MLGGVVVAVLIWGGFAGPVSDIVWGFDTFLRDRLSLILEPGEEREDLVFLGIDGEGQDLDQSDVAASRALQLISQSSSNHALDRRVYAELIEKLAAAGAKVIILDVIFVGSSEDELADREFAETLHRHRDKVVMATMLRPSGDGFYDPLSSVQELSLGSKKPGEALHEGYVNLWPDAEDEVVRRMVYTTSLGELHSGQGVIAEREYESLSAVTARLLGKEVPAGRSPRLRFATPVDERSSYSAAYAPHSLHSVFVPSQWQTQYGNGTFFRDKVVLVSTATKEDGDSHPIPGATIFGGQVHLQALGSWLNGSYWERAPQWVDMVALLAMATLAVAVGIAFRNPLTILCAALALSGGLVMVCAWISSATGILFAGTPGLIGLGMVTICAEIGHLVAKGGGERGEPEGWPSDGRKATAKDEEEPKSQVS
jgi:CHASE2 domain-containing sensor protein